jgi:flagellar hook-length control protein FliK
MFVAENQRVKEIIEAGFNQLRDALEEQGISVAQIEVSVGNGDQNQNEFSFEGRMSSNRINNIMENAMQEALVTDEFGEDLAEDAIDIVI